MADRVIPNINPDIKAVDNGDDTYSVSVQLPVTKVYNAPVEVVNGVDIGVGDGLWIDQGDEIDCRGYNVMTVWVDLTVNDSTGNQIQLLSKHTAAGAQEYVLPTAADYQKVIGNASINIVYTFDLDNAIPYIQMQTRATDVIVGAGDEATVTINYVLGNK